MSEEKILFKTCFPEETEEYTDFFLNKVPKQILKKTVGDKLVSALYLVEKQMTVARRDFSTRFVTAVGTLPEYRGRGFVDGLLRSALEKSKGQADFLTLGTEDKHGLYQKYGFVTYTFFEETTLTANGQKNCQLVEIKDICPDAAKHMEKIYREFVKGKNGYVIRDREYFLRLQEEIFADGGKLFLVKGQDFAGYIYDDHGYIREFVLSDQTLENSIREFEGRKVKRFTQRGSPHNMIRMLRPLSVLDRIEYAQICDTVDIELKDSIIEENNICFCLTVDKGVGKVMPSENRGITLDISTLTALVMGLDTECPQKIKKLFRRQENVVLDRY